MIASDIGKRLRNMTRVLALTDLGKEELLAIATDADALLAKVESRAERLTDEVVTLRERLTAAHRDREAVSRSLAEARSELAAVVAAAERYYETFGGISISPERNAVRDALRSTLSSLSDAARARDEALRAEGREQAAAMLDEAAAHNAAERDRVTTSGGLLWLAADFHARVEECLKRRDRIRALRADKDGR